MTTTAEDIALPVVELPYRLPVRDVLGDPAYPGDCDPDGDPLRLIIDSPPDRTAVAVCGGEVAWWRVCEYVRMPDAWQPPHGVTARRTGDQPGAWLVTGPGGEMLVQRTAPTR